MAIAPISVARRRATLAKRTLTFGSVLAFAVTFGLARSSHAAHATSSASGSSQTSSGHQHGYGDTASGSGSFGQADVGPATSQSPSVSTGVS
jgi:hypothetical protein